MNQRERETKRERKQEREREILCHCYEKLAVQARKKDIFAINAYKIATFQI